MSAVAVKARMAHRQHHDLPNLFAGNWMTNFSSNCVTFMQRIQIPGKKGSDAGGSPSSHDGVRTLDFGVKITTAGDAGPGHDDDDDDDDG